MTVQASDGGQLHVQMPREPSVKFSGPYVELVASVMNATTVKIMSCIDLGPDVDMSLVNSVIQLTHDPRFSNKFWTS
ncbi:hypothetical protein AX17_001391 [Amanita inopinata Kibby_2008]|nr:hypothetical protein AX17_001391 [Amanita inopinata Kibby_2008]